MDARYRHFALAALAFSVAVAGPVQAQETDGRWLAFVGCWEPLGAEPDAGLLCVRPVPGGVELFTVAAGEVETSDIMIADGTRRSLSAEGCEGWESVVFSTDGRRAFTRSEFTCADVVSQSGSGVIALVSPTQWVDVRSTDVDGEQVAWVQRYQLVGPDRAAEEGVEDPAMSLGRAVRAARLAAATGVDLGDVEEAAREVDAKSVEAWLAANGESFDPTAEELIHLVDAGVPESVIDVVIAVSFPERFGFVDSDPEGRARERTAQYGARRTIGFGPRLGLSSYWSPFYNGYGYGYGYVPMGNSFGYYGCGYGYCGYAPTAVIIEPRAPAAGGRLVKGRGYTRDGASSGGGSSGGASSGAGARPASTPASSSGGGGGSEPERRTARPRGPGG